MPSLPQQQNQTKQFTHPGFSGGVNLQCVSLSQPHDAVTWPCHKVKILHRLTLPHIFSLRAGGSCAPYTSEELLSGL